MNKPKIVVTGANGQLGRTFREIENQWSDYDFVFLDSRGLNITDLESIHSVFNLEKPDYIINCAAYTAVDKAEEEKDIARLVNATAVQHLADVCKKYNTLLIHYSSDYVYHPKAPDGKMNEDYPCSPKGIYAQTKLEGEEAIIKSGVPSIILRTSWVYSQYSKNFVKTMLRLGRAGKDLSVVNDQIGAPTHTYDIASTTMKMINSIQKKEVQISEAEIYNYAGEGQISWYDFAKAIFEKDGINVRLKGIPSKAYPTPASRPHWSVLDMTKIKTHFGIAPKWWKERLAEVDFDSLDI